MGIFLNNYKKKPFIPAIQKTSTLVLLSALALLCFTVTVNFKIIEKSSSFDQKVVAATLMSEAMKLLKNHRMEEGIFVDIENGKVVNKLLIFIPKPSVETSICPGSSIY